MKLSLISVLKIIQSIFRFLFFIWFANIFFTTGQFYGQFGGQEDVITFFTTEHSFKVYNKVIDPLAILQIEFYNLIILKIWVALAFYFIVIALDYWIDRDNHFITKIKERWKNVQISNRSD